MPTNPSITAFNPGLLISGDNLQRDNWVLGNGSSIFIKSIPDEFDEIIAREFFESFGTISKVVIDSNLTGGQNMIVHFHEWSNFETIFIKNIAKVFPNPAIVVFNNSTKGDFLECYININPISIEIENEILKDRVAILQKEIKKMKIEVLQRDELIDSLFEEQRSNYMKLPETTDLKRRDRVYIRCPIYDEDIEIDPPENHDW